MTDVSYVPGDQTAIVGDRCWVLIDAAPDSAVVAEIWPVMQGEPELDALVASLLRLGLGHAPDFALLVATDGRHRLICRGRSGATLTGGGSPGRVDGTGLSTWLERQVDEAVEQVVLGAPPAGSDLRLPASAGVFLARVVVVDLKAGARDRGLAPTSRFTEPPGLTLQVTEASGLAAPVMSTPAPHQPAVLPPAMAPVGAGPDRDGPVGGGPAGPDGDSGTTRYDYLFGATQSRTVEEAAVRPADESDSGLPFPFPGPPAQEPSPRHARPPEPLGPPAPPGPPRLPEPPGPPRSHRAAEPSSQPESYGPPEALGPPDPYGPPGPAPGGLIDAVPWGPDPDDPPSGPTRVARIGPRLDRRSPRPSARSRPPAPLRPPEGPDAADGTTVMRGDPLRVASGPVSPDRIGPTVHALLCPSSHVNPPNSSACRLCGAPLPPQDPVTVLRPVLGVLRLSTGDVITLDRGVVMGRSPRTEFSGGERPHVVRLPSGDGEVSRTHLEVSLDGWHVLVTDLHSTNGTIVVLPGRDPERLHPGEPTPIQPGTLVIVAAEIDFRYEAAE
jgi:hypothetical protein